MCVEKKKSQINTCSSFPSHVCTVRMFCQDATDQSLETAGMPLTSSKSRVVSIVNVIQLSYAQEK